MIREKYKMKKQNPDGCVQRREAVHYKRPENHIDVCQCCVDYQKLLDASKKHYKKYKNAQKTCK